MITTHDALAIGNVDGNGNPHNCPTRCEVPSARKLNRFHLTDRCGRVLQYGLGILRQGDTKTKPTNAFRTGERQRYRISR